MIVTIKKIEERIRGDEVMKWHPFGKKSNVVIEGYRKGCASGPCVHLKADIVMLPSEARKVIDRLKKAVDYAEGKTP